MTNFAVHVKFQRTTGEKAKANAYIRPGPLDSQFKAAVKHLQSFEVTHDGPFLGDDFVKVLRQVSLIIERKLAVLPFLTSSRPPITWE